MIAVEARYHGRWAVIERSDGSRGKFSGGNPVGIPPLLIERSSKRRKS